ncbi:tyrP-A, partial [Symbiodinium sp. KB8]
MNLSTDAWLGVTVFAPYTQPRAFGFRTTRDSSFAQLVHDIRDAELLPCPEHDCVQPLRPQPHDGYLAVVTYPSVLDQDQRRRKAVIVDLSRVGGGIYVETLPTDCTPDRLFTIIHGQMNVDPFEEAVQIWVSNRGQEAPRDEPMLHTHGDVLHVIRAEYGKPFNAPDDILFSPTAHWGRIDHMPEPPVLRSTALSCGTDIFAFDPSFFPNERPQDAALRLCRKFCRLPPQSAKVSLVDNCPPLHIEGFTCRQTFVIHDDAPDRAQLTDPAPHCHYLLDLRPLGLAPRTATTTCCAPDLPDILIAADVSVPAGLCGTLLHSRLFGDLQVLKIGVARDLATRILGDVGGVPPHSTLSRVTETSAQELNSAPDCPAGRLSDFSMPVPATRAGEPTVFPREGRCPEAHEALYLADAETTTAEAGTFRAGFHVLIPDFHAETYELPLEAPCDLDEVLHMLADTRDSDASWYFDHIIPAYPQPDPSFVCVIAVPIWAGDFRFSAVDTRAIDGRLFSFVFPERLNRSSILLHIGLPASADLRVFLGNDELETHGLYDFSLGITVTVLPPDFSFRPGLPLEVRLADRHGWAIPCPTFGGVEGPKFGLLSEGLPKLIQADTEAVTSSAFFKAAAARLCAYQLERVTVCPTVPQLQNFAFLGHHCDAVIAATESISRIPVPPGRLMIRQHVVFFDARLALQGLSWTTAPNGFLNHDEVIRRFQATMPVDYAVNIKGGHIAHKGADTLLRVDHDCLLTITFNEDFGSSILRSSPSQGPSGQAADTDSSDTDSDTSSPTGSTSATAPAAPRASPPRGSRNRSRSTRRHCPLPDNELALCSGKPDAVCVAPCPLIASMPGQWYKDVSSFCTQWFPWLETTALVGCELQPLAPLRGLKLLQEPACQTFAEEEQLRVLYEATRQLGGNWLADRRPLLPNWLLINPDPMPHLADELPDFTQWISCAVLKVGFLPEHHTILLHIPATPEEAIHAIQAVRAPDLRSAFPTLLAVLPQPCFGTAVYIAVPAWLPGLQGICIDTSQVDGRLFATTLPDYIDRWEVLRHAHMPTEVEVEVWADTAPHVLVGNDIAHVFPGELITVIRPGDDVPIPYTIGQLLLSRQVWSETSQLPVPAHGAVYGLIFKGRLFIHSEPFHNPMHYRQRIADAVGAPAATMRLFAAHSRPSDVCVHGLPCGALIAIGVPPPGPPQVWHCVILDCRYIADGWREVYVYNGRLDVSGLLQQLQGEAPLGWRVKLSIIADAAGFAYPPPGEVITVTYTLPQIDTPPSTPASEPAPPSAHGDPEETSSLAAYSDAADDAPSVHEATLPTSESLDHHAEAVPDVTVLALPASPYITCIISMPEYTDEVLRVPLEQTATLATLLESLKALRAPTYADLFPFLLCVRPQPDPRYLRFLALPAWPCEGTPVLFAVQDTSRRTFAVRTSAILRYAGAMVLASLPEDGSYQVFIGNSDEELSRFVAAPLSPGDLIVLVPTFDRPSRHAVADLLAQAATAGGPPAPSPVSTPSCIWLLTDDGSVHFPAAPRRGWSFADAVAAHIHADTSTLSTAVSSPSIRDHACCGVPSANVVLAMSSVVDTRDIPPGSVPYILDQRPVLLPIYAAWAESGIVSVLDICRRAQPRCPPDYCVRLSGGTSTPGSENHWRRVCPGEVLVVRFEPAHTHVFSTGHEAPQQHIDGVPDPPSFANNFSESDTASIDASSSSRVADAGTGTSPEAYSALTAFATSLRHYLSVLVTVEHEHVTGHAGHLGNELCDALAKIARKGPQDLFDRCMPTWPSKWAKHPLSEWAWATLPHQPDVPRLFCFDTEVTLSQMQPPTSVEAPEYGLEHVKHPAADAQFVLTCISLNVLTLRDPKPQQVPTGVGLCLLGRKDLLKQSLAPYTPLFIGLQETRIPETSVQPDPDYLIFNAACNAKGDYGCALWISKHVPLYSTPEGPVFVQRPDVTVVGVSPRHLTAHIQTPRLSLQVQVFHAPSTASFPIAEVRDFWDARATEVIGRSQGADYLILCDANARLGNVISDYVGEHGAEDEGEAGELLHEFLTKVDALAPSTWACWHHGPHHTWCSPHGSLSRIDYVLVPFPWQHAHLESRTLPDVELMQLREDHVPVLLTCRFCKQLPPQAYSQARSCTVRPDLTARGPHASSLLQQHVPITVWATDVDEHYQALATAWQAFGHTLSPDCTTAVQQPYLTQATYTHVLERRQLRALLRIGAEERRRRWMLIGFAVFIVHARQAAFSPRQQQTADHWLCIMDWDEASLLARYRQLARVLRRSVAEDRTAYLASLAQEVADGNIGDPKSLYRVLRRAFPAARPSRRQALTPLPMLRLPDGSLASDTETRAETWRAHFASQEVGLLTNADDYAADFATQQLVPRSLDIQIVPTLRALERHILATKVCKAAGPDGITAELLKLHVPSTARQLLPVLIKASLRVQEPIVFRGGSLVCLAKRAGLALSCESYRSILVSSIPGKLYHRHVRETLKPLLLDSQMDFQAGVAPGQGIEGISLAVRSFFALCQTGGTCASISFFDLQAAFYQVLREALVPATDDDAGLLRVLHALQLPPAAVTELHEHLQHAAQLPLLGASCHVTATIQDLFRGTWFRLSGFTALTLTKRGSRPGDPTADLLFGFTLSALFKSVHQALDTRGLCPEIPHTSSRPDCLGDCESVLLGFPAWADDFVAPQTGEDTSSLVHRTGQTVSTVIDFATAAGMTVKFGRDKTALLFPPAVLRQERDLFELDAEGCLCLPLRNSVTDVSVQVPVVEAYRHLGGVITSTGHCVDASLARVNFRSEHAPSCSGEWRAFRGLARTTRAQQSFGPRLPTAAERTPAAVSDSDPLTSLSKGFVPDASHVIWISEYIEGRSKEGQRQNSHRFWVSALVPAAWGQVPSVSVTSLSFADKDLDANELGASENDEIVAAGVNEGNEGQYSHLLVYTANGNGQQADFRGIAADAVDVLIGCYVTADSKSFRKESDERSAAKRVALKRRRAMRIDAATSPSVGSNTFAIPVDTLRFPYQQAGFQDQDLDQTELGGYLSWSVAGSTNLIYGYEARRTIAANLSAKFQSQFIFFLVYTCSSLAESSGAASVGIFDIQASASAVSFADLDLVVFYDVYIALNTAGENRTRVGNPVPVLTAQTDFPVDTQQVSWLLARPQNLSGTEGRASAQLHEDASLFILVYARSSLVEQSTPATQAISDEARLVPTISFTDYDLDQDSKVRCLQITAEVTLVSHYATYLVDDLGNRSQVGSDVAIGATTEFDLPADFAQVAEVVDLNFTDEDLDLTEIGGVVSWLEPAAASEIQDYVLYLGQGDSGASRLWELVFNCESPELGMSKSFIEKVFARRRLAANSTASMTQIEAAGASFSEQG